MRLSICIDSVYRYIPTDTERLKAAKQAGYTDYEFWAWWNRDVEVLKAAQDEYGLSAAALCTKFIPLTDASQHEAYLLALQETVQTAKKLFCNVIISQVGKTMEGVTRSMQHQHIVAGLKKAASIVADSGITLVVEPLNTIVNHPGYYLSSSEEAAQIIDEVNSPSVRMLFDVYHQQISEGNLSDNILKYIDKIGHFHIAGNPGRKMPLDGEVDYRYVLQVIQQTGYSHAIGLEYLPDEGDSAESTIQKSHLVLESFARNTSVL